MHPSAISVINVLFIEYVLLLKYLKWSADAKLEFWALAYTFHALKNTLTNNANGVRI